MRMWQPYLFIVAIFYARDVAILLVVIYIILYMWMFVKFLHIKIQIVLSKQCMATLVPYKYIIIIIFSLSLKEIAN